MNYNKLIIAGNLTQEPIVRSTNSGSEVVNMRIACNGVSDKDATLYLDVESWDESVIKVATKYLKKGYPVMLDGRLKFNQKVERPFLRVEKGGLTFINSGKKNEDATETNVDKKASATAASAVSAVTEAPEEDIPF